MPPELQKMMDAQMQAYQQAADVGSHFKFLTYSVYAAILICALFSILIFWKLCQIQKLVAAKPANLPENPAWQNEFPAQSTPPPDSTVTESDDERFKPKS